MRTLTDIVRDLECVGEPPPPLPLTGLHYDSRRILPGMAFVAIRGELVDGNNYIAAALARGAVAVLSERPPPPASSPAIAWVQVRCARAALAGAAANWWNHPARRLRLVGVTGTNGKTTTTFLLEAMLRAAGIGSGLLGTIEYHIGDAVLPSPHTTPESYDLQELLARMVAAGDQVAVMEVSSHALALDRVWGCPFQVAVFTNLTQDHLDFHGGMAQYLAAKRRLFTGLGAPPPRTAVVNVDDPAAAEMVRGFPGDIIGYGFSAAARLRASGLANSPAGVSFRLHGLGWNAEPVASPLLGRVNALNLMAAIASGIALGLPPDLALAAAAALPRVPGRFERVFAGQSFTVVVDYAHTPDALVNVLALARQLTTARVLLVFGCGGDRDRGKRPLMGAAAVRGADWVMLTSDNPRTEDPESILNDIAAGTAGAATPVLRQPDRRAAIAAALAAAQPGDLVVIAGKGHEDYQIVGDRKTPFSDRLEAERCLR